MKKKAEPAAATGSHVSAEAADLVREALHDEALGLDRMTNARVWILKLFARVDRLSGEIDYAFAGQPFMPHLPPDHPRNVRRAKTYIRLHQYNTKLLESAIRLWMLTFGMKSEDDWGPIVIERMRQDAAQRNRSAAPHTDATRTETTAHTCATHGNSRECEGKPVNVTLTEGASRI